MRKVHLNFVPSVTDFESAIFGGLSPQLLACLPDRQAGRQSQRGLDTALIFFHHFCARIVMFQYLFIIEARF